MSKYSNPDDIKIWPGTVYHMYHTLRKYHQVLWIGDGFLEQIRAYRSMNFDAKYIDDFRYLKLIGEIISERINRLDYDIVFFGNIYYTTYLNCNIPIVQISDITFEHFLNYLELTNEKKINENIEIERLAMKNDTHTIYSSEWIKQKAIEFYGTDPDTIDVVDVGANIPLSCFIHLSDIELRNGEWKKCFQFAIN